MFAEIISNLLRSGKKGGFRRNLLAIYLRKTRPVTLYHGTSDVCVPSIRSGIKTMTGANFRGRSQFGEGFYLTRLKIAAQYFADIAAQNTGGKPEILRFKIPRNAFKKLKGYEIIGAEYREFSWRMLSKFIENFDYLSGQISGLEPWKQVKFNFLSQKSPSDSEYLVDLTPIPKVLMFVVSTTPSESSVETTRICQINKNMKWRIRRG